MKTLVKNMPVTVGTYVLKQALLELVAEVENLERERDDALEELEQYAESSRDNQDHPTQRPSR